MRFDEGAQALKAKIVTRSLGESHGRASALLAVAAINPARRKALLIRRPVVMEEALRGMKDLTLLDPQRLELGEHVLEISGRRLVGAAILRGVDRVEIDPSFSLLPEKLSLSTFDRMASL